MKRIILTFIVAGVLSACSVTSKEGVMQAETRKSGFMGMSVNEAIEVNTPDAFAGKQQVVIGGFKVGFNDSKRLQNKAKGTFLSSASGGKSTGLVKLEGVSAQVMQNITDKAYSDFVKQLQAQGYTVIERSNFTGHTGYQKTKEYDFPYKDDNSGLLSSYGTMVYYSPREIGQKQPIFSGEIEGVTGGFGFANPMNAVALYGEETGIPVLNVVYLIDFAGAGGHESTMTSSLAVGQLLSVDRGLVGIGSGHGGTFSKKIGNMSLGQPIGSQIEFATIESESSELEKGLETGLNAVTALLGGGTNQSRKFVFNADPDKFEQASLDVLAKANDTFVSKMKSLR